MKSNLKVDFDLFTCCAFLSIKSVEARNATSSSPEFKVQLLFGVSFVEVSFKKLLLTSFVERMSVFEAQDSKTCRSSVLNEFKFKS